MKNIIRRIGVTWLVSLFLLHGSVSAAERLWQPVRDDVYLQEVGRKVVTSFPLTSVAIHDGNVFAGSTNGLHILQDAALVEVAEMREPVLRLVSAQKALWLIIGSGLYRFEKGSWKKISDQPVTDVCEHLGEVIVAGGSRLWRIREDRLEPLSSLQNSFPITRVVSYSETLYIHGPGRLTIFDGERFGARNVWNWEADKVWDWGELPSRNTRDILSAGSRLFVATDRGLGVLRGMSLTSIRGEQGLCYEDATCLAKGFGGDIWIGTTRGAIRTHGQRISLLRGTTVVAG